MLKDSAERSPAMDLLDQLRGQLLDEEMKMRRRLDRARGADEKEQAWADFHRNVEPIRREIDAVNHQLAKIEAAKVRPVILVEDDDGYIPFEGPLHRDRGPKKLTPEDQAKLQELVEKLKLRGRMRRAGHGVGQ